METYLIPQWAYTIKTSEGIKTGKWETTLPASEICQWFESKGEEVLTLKRIATQKKMKFNIPPVFNVAFA